MKNELPGGAYGALFTLSPAAVIGVQSRVIAFMNPAAQRALGRDETGSPAARLLPPHVLQSQAAEFVTAATVAGRHAVVTVTSLGSLRLCTLAFDADEPVMPTPVFAPQMTALGNLRLVADYFTRYGEENADEKLAWYASELVRCYYTMHRWVSNAATLAALRASSLPFQPVPTELCRLLADLLDGARFFAERHGIALQLELPETETTCALDPALIEQMVLNIVSNSLRHCCPGDCVHVTLAAHGAGSLVLAFHDTGTGIPGDRLADIFRGYRPETPARDESGAGLGLAVALGIAELHGGTILVESSEKNGTSVRVLLSATLPAAAPLRADPPAYQARQSAALLTGLADFLDTDDCQEKFQ